MLAQQIVTLVGRLTDPVQRLDSAKSLASKLGVSDLMVFVVDPSLKILLPAPMFPQTLPEDRQWREFLAGCTTDETCTATLASPYDRRPVTVFGMRAADGSLLVLLGGVGGKVHMEEAREICLLLPLVTAPLRSESGARGAQTKHTVVSEAAAKSDAHARTSSILENFTEAFAAVDSEWRFTYVNAKAESIYGMQRSELLGRGFWEVFPQALGTIFEREYRRAMADRVSVRVESPFDRPKGLFLVNVFPVEGGGLSFYFLDVSEKRLAEEERRRKTEINEALLLGALRQNELAEIANGQLQQEITERKKAEADLLASAAERERLGGVLRESEERFRAIADNIPQLAWMADGEGQIDWFNRGWLDYTGTSLEENLGGGWKAVHHPDHIEAVAKKFERHLQEGKDWEDTFPLRGKDGKYRWFLSRMKAIRDEAGTVVRFFGTNTDITEVHEAEEVLKEADRRKDEFMAVMSHELRTPLTAMLGWTKILTSHKMPPEKIVHGLQVIERNVKVQAQLIDDLLDVSRIVTGKLVLNLRPLDIKPVIEAAIESVRPALDAKNLELRAQLEPVRMPGDQNRLQQVVSNLLANAIKFTPKGGKIEILAERADSQMRIVVRDNGRGIDADFLPELFKRFQQADVGTTRLFGGLGLGLSIVRHLVEMHGGKISAESDGEGKGASFMIDRPVPVFIETEESASSDAVSSSVKVLDGMRILVVDDDADTREILEFFLKTHGAHVVTALNVAEAIEHFKHLRPDMVVSDIGMPGEDGYSLIRRIRTLREDEGGKTPALALTAFARDEDQQQVFEAGFNAYSAKPIEPQILIAKVAAITRGNFIPSDFRSKTSESGTK